MWSLCLLCIEAPLTSKTKKKVQNSLLRLIMIVQLAKRISIFFIIFLLHLSDITDKLMLS